MFPSRLLKRAPVLASVLLLSLALPETALGEDSHRAVLEEGQRLYEEEVDYLGALDVFLGLAMDESVEKPLLDEARLLAAFCLVALDRSEEAHELLVSILVSSPDYRLPPYTSPKLREAVEAARADAFARILAENAAAPEPDEPRTQRRRRTAYWPLSLATGVGAASALGAGITYGVEAKRAEDRLINDPDSFSSHSEAMAFRDAAMVKARHSNILFISAAALTTGAGVFFFLDRSSPRLALAPTEDGALVLATLRW